MYVPAHFALTAEQVHTALGPLPAGHLITTSPEGLQASFLPMVVRTASNGRPASLVGHLARVDSPAAQPGPALFIVPGPNHLVGSALHGSDARPAVPTWNYVTIHVHGTLSVHRDPEWIRQVLDELVAGHNQPPLPAELLARLLPAVVGVELKVDHLVGKAKMSQNKPPEVVAAVIEGLRAQGGDDVADWMAENSLPRARAKADLLAGLRRSAPEEGLD